MLKITPEENQALADIQARAQKIRERLAQIGREVRTFPSAWDLQRLPDDEAEAKIRENDLQVAALNKEQNLLQEELNSLESSEVVLTVSLKEALNEKLAEVLPGGSLEAILNIVEGLMESLQGGTGQRVGGILKNLGITSLKALADPDLQMARAQLTVIRYTSLVEAGLPEDLAAKVIVAEASRPLNFPSGTASRK